MGGGTGTGPIYIHYRGEPKDLFAFPKGNMYYLINASRGEITDPIRGKDIFSKLIELSRSVSEGEFSARDPEAWDYLSQYILAVDKDKMLREDLEGFIKR